MGGRGKNDVAAALAQTADMKTQEWKIKPDGAIFGISMPLALTLLGQSCIQVPDIARALASCLCH